MSFGYTIVPLADAVSEEEGGPQIEGLRLSVPQTWRDSRPIILDELRSTFSGWEGYTFHSDGQNLAIHLTAQDRPEYNEEYTQGELEPYERNDTAGSVGQCLNLSYGSPEFLVAVAERMARIFGPVLLVCDVGCAIVVSAGTAPDAEWESI